MSAGNAQALQYKTDQIADVKKIEKLNLLFFSLMAQGSDAEGELCLFSCIKGCYVLMSVKYGRLAMVLMVSCCC